MPRTRHHPKGEPLGVRRIDPTSGVPRSVQATRNLREAIESGAVGPALPNQHELAAQMGTSLATIRRAIEALQAEHRVVAVPAVGTFVRTGPVGRDRAPKVLLATQDLGLLTSSGSWRSVLMGAEDADGPVQAGELAGKRCWHWQWGLLSADLEALAVVEAWAVRSFARGAEGAVGPGEVLKRARIDRLEGVARAAAARPEERRVLGLGQGDGVMVMTVSGFGPDGGQVLYAEWALGPSVGVSLSFPREGESA